MSLATVVVYLISYLGFMPPQIENTSILLQALSVAALLPAFHLLRYLLLSQNLMLWWLAIVTLALFMLAGLTTLIFPIEYWFAISGILLAMAFLITVIKAYGLAKPVTAT